MYNNTVTISYYCACLELPQEEMKTPKTHYSTVKGSILSRNNAHWIASIWLWKGFLLQTNLHDMYLSKSFQQQNNDLWNLSTKVYRIDHHWNNCWEILWWFLILLISIAYLAFSLVTFEDRFLLTNLLTIFHLTCISQTWGDRRKLFVKDLKRDRDVQSDFLSHLTEFTQVLTLQPVDHNSVSTLPHGTRQSWCTESSPKLYIFKGHSFVHLETCSTGKACFRLTFDYKTFNTQLSGGRKYLLNKHCSVRIKEDERPTLLFTRGIKGPAVNVLMPAITEYLWMSCGVHATTGQNCFCNTSGMDTTLVMWLAD